MTELTEHHTCGWVFQIMDHSWEAHKKTQEVVCMSLSAVFWKSKLNCISEQEVIMPVKSQGNFFLFDFVLPFSRFSNLFFFLFNVSDSLLNVIEVTQIVWKNHPLNGPVVPFWLG